MHRHTFLLDFTALSSASNSPFFLDSFHAFGTMRENLYKVVGNCGHPRTQGKACSMSFWILRTYLNNRKIRQIIPVSSSRVLEVHRNTHGCHLLRQTHPCSLKSKVTSLSLGNLSGFNHGLFRELSPAWLLQLSGLSADLRTKRSPVQFPVRAHYWVAGQGPSRGCPRGNHTLMFLSLSLSLPSTL